MSPNGLAANEFLYELPAKKKLTDLILPKLVRQGCAQFLEEHHKADLLRAHQLAPRHRALLSGPPGNGKPSPVYCSYKGSLMLGDDRHGC